jgi:hypothetical protein
MRLQAPSAALLPLLLCACVTSLDSPEPAATDAPQRQDEDSAAAKLRARRRALSKAERELRAAEGALPLVELKAEIEVAGAEQKLVEAQHTLLAAREEHASFNAIERVRATEQAALAVDEAKDRLRRAEEELAGLVAIYDEEEHAERAVKEVLRRNEVAVGFRQRELAQAERAQRLSEESTLPRRAAKLESEAQKAEAGQLAAELEVRRAKLASALERGKAEDAVEAAREALEDATRALDEARGRATEPARTEAAEESGS